MGPPRFDVFLSYNSADRPAVERIAEQLREQRLEPWWDRWALTAGRSWQEEIVEGMRASGACAVLVGPAGLGDWAREELAVAQDQAAKDRRFRTFMVLLPGAPELSDPGLAFLRTRTWVDLRGGADGNSLQDLVAAITGIPPRREVTVGSSDICPYRGLEAFDEEHAEFFFGREDDVALLSDKLKASRFLAVVGPSGTGKSSLLRAGLVPALHRGILDSSDTWGVRVFSPGSRPLTALAAQMTHLFPEAPMQATLDGLREDARSLDLAAAVALGDRPPVERVLLVIDQFEELFVLCSDEDERSAFLASLLYAATIPGGRVVVVVGMRADFYQRCASYADLRVLVADHQFLVGPLDGLGLRRAIEEPAHRLGLELEAGLVETMTGDVAHRPGSLPLLEHLLLELWQRRQGTMLTLQAYVASGQVEGALAQRANATYSGLSPIRREIARRVLLRLVQPGEGAQDTRRRAEMSELVTRSDEEDDVNAVVQALADQRLIITGRDDLSGARVVDMTHEALIRGWPELSEWVNEDREALRAQRHLSDATTEWDRRGRRDDDLYGGARLAYWKERRQSQLTEVERSFVAAGVRREDQAVAARRRRTRLAVSGLVVGLLVVAIVALAGSRAVSNQRHLRDTTSSRQLAAQSAFAGLTNPLQGLFLAVNAYEIKPTREAQAALTAAAKALSRAPAGHVNLVQFSPDHRQIVSAADDGTVRVWDLARGGNPSVERASVGHVSLVEFSPDGRWIVSAADDGTVRVWDWAAGGVSVVLRGDVGPVNSAVFSPDGRLVASAGYDGTVRVWDWAAGVSAMVWKGHVGPVNSAEFSPDGRLVASAGYDGTVQVWDLAGGGHSTVKSSHDGPVSIAAFSPDGRLFSVSGDGTVRVWDVARGHQPVVLKTK